MDWGLLVSAASLVGFPYALGAGVLMAKPSKNEAAFAKACFWASAVLAVASIIGVTKDWPMNAGKLTLVAVVGAAISVALSFSLDWVRGKTNAKTSAVSVDHQNSPVTPSASLMQSPPTSTANMEVNNTENFSASKNITLGPGKLAVVNGGKNIVINGNFVDMANRQSESLDDYRDADLGKLSNSQLRSTILEFVNAIREFGRQSRTERDEAFTSPLQGVTDAEKSAAWNARNKKYSELNDAREAKFDSAFRGQMLALLSEAAERTNAVKDLKSYGILIAYRSFAGVDAIGDAADQLEKVGRRLPSS